MLKTSEVLQLAKDHPKYLDGIDPCNNWLCCMLVHLRKSGQIKPAEESEASVVIEKSIASPEGGYSALFLRGYLIATDVLPISVRYSSPEYRVAAHDFWADLITKLQAEGR